MSTLYIHTRLPVTIRTKTDIQWMSYFKPYHPYAFAPNIAQWVNLGVKIGGKDWDRRIMTINHEADTGNAIIILEDLHLREAEHTNFPEILVSIEKAGWIKSNVK